ncbi:SpoIIE family protein phosphatase [Paenibacillus sp. TRM 82003]|uniref:GAF domain-containing SpoIIE family protein phosphatase n=1 Tax=Kineococcus sp. TRM81007 TaxID=2925831 RepID=UPI001F5986D1|nr:GAF domain-containing SpoIIE family protein phosphatase [Kineococcus sp. TRM81007]MCI2239560.1 SpoIIE family protein phosphatase [Kineococcus sp. TRM81007]MCI3926158.1 SpoIIE family protein phosphatase [Paenibacillus sp. TRM 82003]
MEPAAGGDAPLLRALQEVSDGTVVLDAEHWRVVHADAAGAAVHGLRAADVQGRLLGEVLPAVAGSEFLRLLERARTGDGPVEWTGPAPGTGLPVQVRARRLDGHVLCAYRDVSREQALRRERDQLTRSLHETVERTSRLLALAEALTATTTVTDVARVVVDTARSVFGAAHAGLSVVDAERGVLRTPFLEELAPGGLEQWEDLPLGGPGPGTAALREQRPRFEDGDALRERYPELAARWEAADVSYLAAVPLVAAGRGVGLVTLVWSGGNHLRPEHRTLLEASTSYATQALQRALLLTERTEVARTLQRAMLTAELPQPDDLHLAARYLPAHAGAQVGGDWYDVLLLPGGATLLVIGDVAGHDVVAAAAMGQLRIALRALAVDRDETPARLLERLEAVVASLGGEPLLASCLVGRVEQTAADRAAGRRVLRWAWAGHPPPLLVHADGRVDVLRAEPDVLLGVPGAGESTRRRSDHRAELPTGSTLLLYTDGLVERRDADLDAGVERLRAAATALAGAPGDALAEALDRLLSDAAPAGGDDVAVLAVRFGAQR